MLEQFCVKQQWLQGHAQVCSFEGLTPPIRFLFVILILSYHFQPLEYLEPDDNWQKKWNIFKN